MTVRLKGLFTLAFVGAVIALVLAGCGGGGGGGAASGSAPTQTGSIVLEIAGAPSRDRGQGQSRTIPPTTTAFQIDVLDPDTSQALVPSQTVPYATQTVTVTVRVGKVLVGITALNSTGSRLQSRWSQAVVVADQSTSVQTVFAPLNLRFLAQPTGSYALARLNSIVVAIVDDQGSIVDSEDTVTLAKPAGAPAYAVLQGQLSVKAQSGLAVFENVHVSPADANITLLAQCPSAQQRVTSNAFGVSPLPPNYDADTPLMDAGMPAPACVDAGDFNGDGFVDVVIADATNQSLIIRLGNGTGYLSPPLPAISLGFAPRRVIARDLDGDGKLDLVVQGISQSSISLLPGNGDATFRAPVIRSLGANVAGDVVVGDVNRDGRPDLVVLANTSPSGTTRVIAYGNQGGFNFVFLSEALSGAIGVQYGISLDFIPATATTLAGVTAVVEGGADTFLELFANDGVGNFTLAQSDQVLNTLSNRPNSMVAGSFGSSRVALGYTNTVGPVYRIRIYGPSGGSFGVTQTLNAVAKVRAMQAYDVNADNWLDLVTEQGDLGSPSKLEIYLFDPATGLFNPAPTSYDLDVNAQKPTWGVITDLNNDYLPDILVTCAGGTGVLSRFFHSVP